MSRHTNKLTIGRLMCGIAGFFLKAKNSISRERILAASDAIAYRGPDDEGFFLSADQSVLGRRDCVPASSNWGLIHRRLSIFDLSDSGWQPMIDAESGLAIILNGEIYNFRELAAELSALGCQFRSSSDTEVALQAWKCWGPDAINRFRGMFAIAVVDQRNQVAWLGRDPLGIKPIFILTNSEGVFFGSTSAAVLALSGAKPKASVGAAWNFIIYRSTTCGAESYLEGIEKVPPGTLLKIDLEDPSRQSSKVYWTPEVRSSSTRWTEATAAEELRRLYMESAQLHVRSDTEVCISLSGGVDSSALAGIMAVAAPGSIKRGYTFQAKGVDIDETPLARLVAERNGIELKTVQMDEKEFPSLLLEGISSHSEPFPSASILAEYLIYRQVRQDGFKVILTGQGPDEILAGYSWFRSLRLATLFKSGRVLEALRLNRAFSKWPDSPRPLVSGWMQLALLPNSIGPGKFYSRNRARFVHLMKEDMKSQLATEAKSVWRLDSGDCVRSIIARNAVPEGLQNQLIWSDQNSMRWSVESRVPYVTPEIVDFALQLPDHFLVGNDGTCKNIHRKAVADSLPPEILAVRKKLGFETDENLHLRAAKDFIESGIAALPLLEEIGLDPIAAESEVRGWLASDSTASDLVFRLLSLALWRQTTLASP